MQVAAGHLQRMVVVEVQVLQEVEEERGNLEVAEEFEAQGVVEVEIEIF